MEGLTFATLLTTEGTVTTLIGLRACLLRNSDVTRSKLNLQIKLQLQPTPTSLTICYL